MKENIQRIFTILAKDSLMEQDKDELESLLSSDPEAKEFFNKFNRLKDFVKDSSHLTEDDLAEYILFRNKNPEYNFASSKIKFIEEHIRKCAKCSPVFLKLSEEYSAICDFTNSSLQKSQADAQPAPVIKRYLFQNKFSRYSFITVTAVIALFFSLAIISQLVTPKNIKLAKTKDNSLFYITRGRASDEFQKGLLDLGEKKFGNAINYFEQDINKNKNDGTIFYTHYILGLTYLEISEKNFLGLFPSFDKLKVNKAIDNFKKCIVKNNSGNFPDITSNSYYFLAKAELMLGESEEAKKGLEMVIKIKGSKIDQAKELLNNLE